MTTTTQAMAVAVWLGAAALAGGDDTWKAPLSAKAAVLEEGIQRKHNILGLYPSMIEIPPDGGPIDVTTSNPFADIQHAVCWTSNYLAGLSYRCAFLEASGAPEDVLAAARRRADEVFEAVYRCQRVTGVRGLQARGYLLGHGETYAERTRSSKLPFWRQGEVDGQAFRWVGDPSHHNYSDAIHGLGQYYDLAARGEQKERAREAIDALVSYWVDNDLRIAKYDTSLPAVPILGVTDGKTLNTRVFMAIAGARIAHYATGKEKFMAVFDRLVDQYSVRGLERFETSKDFDDAEHVFCHLDLLCRIENDPELLAAYRKVADGLWANHLSDAQSLFTYVYYAIAPDAPGKGQALRDALRSLRTFPTDMTLKPRMNSLTPDVKPPYPTYLTAWDNEYLWKGHLLQADGWLSRIVTDVAVSREDPMVIYAVDEAGGLYQSRDGAASWQNWRPVDQSLDGPVRAVDTGERSRILAVACDDGFHLSTTAGAQWRRMPVPPEAGRPVDVLFDPEDACVIYALGAAGVYRSRDFGEEFLGQSWECLSDGLPQLDPVTWVVAPGNPGRVYAVTGATLFTRTLENPNWSRGTDFGLSEYAQVYPWVAVDPGNPDRLLVGMKSTYSELGVLSLVQESTDAGTTWSNTERDLLKVYAERGVAGLIALGVASELSQLVVDAESTNTLYAAASRGVLRSTDGGKSWQHSEAGLGIPLVRSLVKPWHSGWLFAGTPGGLYVSKDGGTTWEEGNLWLQFTKNTRRELGGAAFLDAYWRARYHGFIDEAEANAPCDRE